MTNEQYDRLVIAKKTGKYGHLCTWEELYYFQKSIATPQQLQDIAMYARDHGVTGKVTLPLKDFVAQQQNENI